MWQKQKVWKGIVSIKDLCINSKFIHMIITKGSIVKKIKLYCCHACHAIFHQFLEGVIMQGLFSSSNHPWWCMHVSRTWPSWCTCLMGQRGLTMTSVGIRWRSECGGKSECVTGITAIEFKFFLNWSLHDNHVNKLWIYIQVFCGNNALSDFLFLPCDQT